MGKIELRTCSEAEGNTMQMFEDYKNAIRWAQENINGQTIVDQIDREKLAWAFRSLFYVKATDEIPPPDEQLIRVYRKVLQRGPLEE
jgi:hypothetical protein